MTNVIGQTISHYKILEHLGGGGMGIVYKAEDTKLKRHVALKFLPPELTRDPESKQRFIHEAQAASALDHPNICTIHEIAEADDGQLFMAMACYDGDTLKTKIDGGPMDRQEAVDIAVQIAQGLQDAHQHEIVHRDIKPANIIVTKNGIVKILDFGLAKLRGQTRLTRTGTTFGTVAYMSPEQTKGDNIDHRTDIWSFGIVLYEMLTGEVPFKGDHEHAIAYSILYEEPYAVDLIRTDIPELLKNILTKVLHKNAAQRYQHMTEVIQVLQSLSLMSDQKDEDKKSIVVLPFVNMSADPEQEYFSDGLTEEIITDLSHIHDLRVISRTSSMMLKATKKDIKTISRELRVQYVLEGSVRKAGNNLRIVAQLIDAKNDAHIWAEKFGGTLDDVFDIQEKVSRSILDALKLKLSSKENRQLGTHGFDDIRAYECYLKARHEVYKLSEESLDIGLDLIEQGLKVTGDNELLYAMKSHVYLQYVNTLSKPPETFASLLKEGQRCAEKALAINPNSSVAHSHRGAIHHQNGNAKGAIYHWRRAIELNPNYSDPLVMLGYQLTVGGVDPNHSRSLIEKGVQLDPLTPVIAGIIGWFHIFNGSFVKALESMQIWFQALEQVNSPYQFLSAWLYAAIGDFDESFRIIDKIVQDMPEHLIADLVIFFKHALLNETEHALASVTEQLKQAAWWDDTFSLVMTDGFALIGEHDIAFRWLEHTIDYGYTNVQFLREHEPFIDNLRGDARFQTLLDKAKYLSESLEG